MATRKKNYIKKPTQTFPNAHSPTWIRIQDGFIQRVKIRVRTFIFPVGNSCVGISPPPLNLDSDISVDNENSGKKSGGGGSRPRKTEVNPGSKFQFLVDEVVGLVRNVPCSVAFQRLGAEGVVKTGR